MLLACHDININKMTIDGVTPFTVSIFKGHTPITTMLLDRPELVLGHNPNAEYLDNMANQDQLLLEAGCQPSIDNVRLAMIRVPYLQSVMLHAATNPLSLKQLSRKVIWRHVRHNTGGRNIQPSLLTFQDEIPASLLNYLKFTETLLW